jgi:hypothetical protein
MRFHALFATVTLLVTCRSALACYDTIVTYEVTRECRVRIVAVHDEHRDPIDPSDWDAAVTRWTEYLQRDAGTDFDKELGVPPTGRKIAIGGVQGRTSLEDNLEDGFSLYCEFDKDGGILAAYVFPIAWDDRKREVVRTGRKSVAVSEGKLVEFMTYEPTITTCY